MNTRPKLDTLACQPLSLEQARLLVAASPSPSMVADVEPGGFSVLAVHPLLRRLIHGARHPAGPVPGEIIAADGFSALAPGISSAVKLADVQQVLEVPIGDEPQWFEIVVTPVADETGCRQILVLAIDRTGDHDIERRHRRAAGRFQAMVTHAPGLILLVDSAGRILRCSPAVDRLLGVAPDELVGRAVFELLHPDSLARAASAFNQILGLPGEPIVIPDFRMSHTSGSALWCEATVTNLLHDDDVAAIVFNAHDITDRRIAEERLELAATSDSLTGLPNRRRLEDRLTGVFEVAARESATVGLVLVDLDDFKLINDGLGHDIGDGVLRALADRLQALIGDRGFVARVGGDEFAVVLERKEMDDDLDRLAEAVHELLRSPVAVGEHDVYVRASIGTTSGHPERVDAASLLRSADLALYRAKRNGRNRTVRFTAELQLEAEDRLTTITELQRALRDGRLRLAYQPVVTGDGATVGAEALLRWEHNGELLSPSEFLELAEDTGLILPIGAWVLEQVCCDLQSLQSSVQGLEWLSVNLSSRQLLDERLPVVLRRTLDHAGVDPSCIAVEIAESVVRGDGRALAVLRSLDGVRVMLSLDDLAADQGALSVLGELPLAAIKLDRAFVQQLDVDIEGRHRTLAMAVIELATEHGVGVVAEGVENERQAQVLRELGCPMLQGFHLGQPVDLGSFMTRGAPLP